MEQDIVTTENFPTFAVLIPAYRAYVHLTEFLPQLCASVRPEHSLVVLDGPDLEAEKLCASLHIPTRSHAVNRGKGAALQTGFAALKNTYQWIITMDADGQHSPADLHHFTSLFATSHSLLIGSRKRSLATMPPARILSNTLTSLLLSLFTGQYIADSQCGYRAYLSQALKNRHFRYQHFEFESEILLQLSFTGDTVTNVPITTIYGNETSNISHLKDTLRWVKAVIFTVVHLRSKGSTPHA